MSRRFLLLGLVVLVSQIATGCCTQRAYVFPRLRCGAYAPPAVPFSPVVRTPLLPRPLYYGAGAMVPISAGPAYGYGAPGCSSCSTPGAAVSFAPQAMSGAPVYSMGGSGYGAGVPHDSVLLPQPTVIPPGTPKVEQMNEPRPMAKQ